MALRNYTRKPTPKSCIDCLMCAIFARQGERWGHGQACNHRGTPVRNPTQVLRRNQENAQPLGISKASRKTGLPWDPRVVPFLDFDAALSTHQASRHKFPLDYPLPGHSENPFLFLCVGLLQYFTAYFSCV